MSNRYAAHLYTAPDPVPQIVIVQDGECWLPDAGKLVAVVRLEGRLVKLIEETTQEEGVHCE